jgi:hypothetical protein
MLALIDAAAAAAAAAASSAAVACDMYSAAVDNGVGALLQLAYHTH